MTGVVSFPMPFPSVGAVSFEWAEVRLSPGGKVKEQFFVVVNEKPTHNCDVARVIRMDDISAIFFPGRYEEKGDSGPQFVFSDDDRVEDFDQGEWFFEGDITGQRIAEWLHIEPGKLIEKCDAKGIIFLRENRPVVTRSEVTEAAGATFYHPKSGCDCCN